MLTTGCQAATRGGSRSADAQDTGISAQRCQQQALCACSVTLPSSHVCMKSMALPSFILDSSRPTLGPCHKIFSISMHYLALSMMLAVCQKQYRSVPVSAAAFFVSAARNNAFREALVLKGCSASFEKHMIVSGRVLCWLEVWIMTTIRSCMILSVCGSMGL